MSKKKKLLKKLPDPKGAKKWVQKKKKQVISDDEEMAAPRITNDTVAEHREEVLSEARQFVSPLQISRKRVVLISTGIIIAAFIGSILFSGLLLYRYKSTSNFAYRISQVIPFPVAKVNGDFVSFEDYLFEVRNTLFYFRNHGQEGIDIDGEEGKQLANDVQNQSLDKVKADALVKQIARDNDITVTEEEVDKEIELISAQGGVSETDDVLNDILRDFYDWDVNDLRRSIRLQILRQKITPILDTETASRAQTALQRIQDGESFASVANEVTDDLASKGVDGEIGSFARDSTEVPEVFLEEVFSTDEGAVSENIVESRFGLQIVKVLEDKGEEREVAHILFTFFDIDEYLQGQLDAADTTDYIDLSLAE